MATVSLTSLISNDSDGDGVIDAFDTTVGHGGNFTTPENTDGTDDFDFRDTDSDNDGLLDVVESGLDPGQDTNGDGIADNIAPDSYQDPDGIVNNPSADLGNELGDTSRQRWDSGFRRRLRSAPNWGSGNCRRKRWRHQSG